MERHIMDRPRSHEDGIRLREYLRMERESDRHPASKELHKKPHAANTSRKVKEYLRIERGHTV